jgi:hypothetical protein
MLYGVNLAPVILGGVASMVLGSFWYSPALFGNQWMKLMGIKPSKKGSMGTMMAKQYGLMFLATLTSAYVLTWVMQAMGVVGIAAGLCSGFWAWLGFVVTTNSGAVIFGQKPLKLFYIDQGYFLAQFLLLGAVIGAFPR